MVCSIRIRRKINPGLSGLVTELFGRNGVQSAVFDEVGAALAEGERYIAPYLLSVFDDSFQGMANPEQERSDRSGGIPEKIPELPSQAIAGTGLALALNLINFCHNLICLNIFAPGLGITVHTIAVGQALAYPVKHEPSTLPAEQQNRTCFAIFRVERPEPDNVPAVAQKWLHT